MSCLLTSDERALGIVFWMDRTPPKQMSGGSKSNGIRYRSSRENGIAMKSSHLMRFWRDTAGASSIEYGLIAAGISVALALTVLVTNRNVACNSSPSPNVSMRQLDKLDLVREPRSDR